jgi:hypothetical protein
LFQSSAGHNASVMATMRCLVAGAHVGDHRVEKNGTRETKTFMVEFERAMVGDADPQRQAPLF